jgi:hypothetical protein
VILEVLQLSPKGVSTWRAPAWILHSEANSARSDTTTIERKAQMGTLRKMGALAAPLVAMSLLGTGCAGSVLGSGLSASSSCKDFMTASASEQHEVVDQLSSHYDKPAYATPLGEPEVPFYCSSSPSITLGQFFQKAED